ncbi:MAG: hypothetical protein L7W43_14785 [Rubripirellula sp.]|nr:hypothetical protein [Rhodopirellula sp.]MCH1440926.1 hypothetical protein [Rubripirellula sp.]
MHRLPTKIQSLSRTTPALVRSLGLIALLGMISIAMETKAEADENQLSEFGLANLTPMAAAEARSIQCRSLFTEHFGISFISGILYDPNTGSSIKVHSIELSNASDFVSDSISVNDVAVSQVSWDRIAEVDIASSIVDFQASMRGLIQATGFALSTY